jgi:hypothetical protein
MVLDIVFDPVWSSYLDSLLEGDVVLRMVEHLDRRSLLHALANNAGAGLLFTSNNGEILRSLVEPGRAGPDLELVGRGLNRLPLVIANNHGKPVQCATPALSLCVVGGLEDLQYCLAGFCHLPQLIRQGCIVFRHDAAPGAIVARMSSPQEEKWGHWIFELFDFAEEYRRYSVMNPGLKASLEARTILAQFRNDAVALAVPLNGVVRDQVLALPHLAARLCTPLSLLHSTGRQLLAPVPAQIATVGVNMAKRFGGLQLAALLEAQGAPEGGLEQVEEQIMLAKINVRGGRVRRRDLYRGYAKQTSALHDPVIARLIAKELLSQEGSGWLVLTHRSESCTAAKRGGPIPKSESFQNPK